MILSKDVINFSLALTLKTKELFFFDKLKKQDLNSLYKPLFFNKLEPRFIKFIRENKIENKIPSNLYKKINEASNIRNLHTLSICNNSVETLKKFNEEKINYCLLKGAYFNTSTYFSHSNRPVKDIDIIIHKRDLFKALELCLKNGYRFKEDGLNHAELDFNFDYRYDLPNLINENNQILELHHRFSDPFDYKECIFLDKVFENTIEKNFFGINVKFPSPMNLILMSIYSGTQKRYFDSGSLFLYDLNEIQKEYDISNQEILVESRKIGIHHCAKIALDVKNNFLDGKQKISNNSDNAKRLIVYNKVSDSKRVVNLYMNKNIFQIMKGLIDHSFSAESVSASRPYKSNFQKLISIPQKIFEQLGRVCNLLFLLTFSSVVKKELTIIKELLGNINEK